MRGSVTLVTIFGMLTLHQIRAVPRCRWAFLTTGQLMTPACTLPAFVAAGIILVNVLAIFLWLPESLT